MKLEQIHEETRKNHRSDRHGDEAANDHRGEHLAHQEFMFFLSLSHCLAGRFRNNGIKWETIQCGQTIAEAQRERKFHNFRRHPGKNGHAENTHNNQANHRENNGGQHFRRAVL